jgi:hypothetical protein
MGFYAYETIGIGAYNPIGLDGGGPLKEGDVFVMNEEPDEPQWPARQDITVLGPDPPRNGDIEMIDERPAEEKGDDVCEVRV